MSPKSRGRPPVRGRPKPRHDRPLRTPTAADRVLGDAGELAHLDVLTAEEWASGHLAWVWAGASEREPDPEVRLTAAVAERVRARPGLAGAAALSAFVRLLDPAAPGVSGLLDGVPAVPWSGAAWTARRACWARDVWQSERLLFIEFAGPEPHVLFAAVDDVGGRWVAELELLEVDAFAEVLAFRAPPDAEPSTMGPAVECPPDEALAYLADALRCSDRAWPRPFEEEYVLLRALAWSRCRAHLAHPDPDAPAHVPVTEGDRAALVSAFVTAADVSDSRTVRSLAGRLVDFGDAWLPVPPLGWSPHAVAHFVQDGLPRMELDDDEFALVPDVLAAWVSFALERRGLEPIWVAATVASVLEACADLVEDDEDPDDPS